MTDQPQGEKPALTVVIQSWWTPALAVIALIAGLLLGYFGRPIINKGTDGGVAAVVTQQGSGDGNPAGTPTATADPTQQALQIKQMMDELISQTTNYQGDADAKVLLIEFSDYQ